MLRELSAEVAEIIDSQHRVIANLRHTLSTLLDELEQAQDETASLRIALQAAWRLVDERYPDQRFSYPIDRPTRN